MMDSRADLQAALAAVVLSACPVLALAADNLDDYWPAQQALSDCGDNYVRNSAAPTVTGAQSRCSAEFERLMKTVALMTRLSQPRMGGPTPEWEEQVRAATVQKRAMMRDDFAKSVARQIAERKS